MADGDVTHEGKKLIERWLEAQQRLRRAKCELNGAECDLKNSQNALARWLMPVDATPGEKIAVWFGDSLVQVTVPRRNGCTWDDAEVTIRTRGRQPLAT